MEKSVAASTALAGASDPVRSHDSFEAWRGYVLFPCVVRIGTSVCESRYVPPRSARRLSGVSRVPTKNIIFISVYASGLAPLALPPSAFAVRTDASVHAPARTISTTEVEEVRPPRPSSGSQWLLLLLPSRALSRPRSVLRLGGGWLSAAPAKTSSAPHRRGASGGRAARRPTPRPSKTSELKRPPGGWKVAKAWAQAEASC